MTNEELKETRKQMFDKMEKHLWEDKKPEDSVFYYHPSEDRIVLSHALFWVMTSTIKGRVARQKHLLLLRQYQEEMLSAYLTEDAEFAELLRYCNILFDYMPLLLPKLYDLGSDKVARRLAATFIVAGGYGGDMKEDLADEILDDMDFVNNRVKCRKIEEMMVKLNRFVDTEMKGMI